MMMSACGELEAQIMFEDIRPKSTTNVKTDIRPKGIHMAPMQRMRAPSKPSAPMPRFKQHNIAPDRIMKSPIQRTNIRPKTIRMNKMTFNPMVKTNIRPQEIRTDTLIRTISPGRKMSLPPPIQPAHWSFNPTLRGHAPPSIPYNSSIRAPMRDYNSPYHKDVPMHPMAW